MILQDLFKAGESVVGSKGRGNFKLPGEARSKGKMRSALHCEEVWEEPRGWGIWRKGILRVLG